jgi:hypothetical protein
MIRNKVADDASEMIFVQTFPPRLLLRISTTESAMKMSMTDAPMGDANSYILKQTVKQKTRPKQ